MHAPQGVCSRDKLKTPHKAGLFNLRSAGVEPTFPASEADALSIELRARKSYVINLLPFYQIIRAPCSKLSLNAICARGKLTGQFQPNGY